MTTTLEALKQKTRVVADTGDFLSISQFRPTDATTNPSLILKASKQPQYAHLLERIRQEHGHEELGAQIDRLLVCFGQEILKLVPGRVSTEVDARLSFDSAATIARAEKIIQLYENVGINPQEHVLIKIASTWEGIQAAKELEKRGIRCNLTLLFSATQAHACAQAGVKLISPFVGRIYDWYKKQAGPDWDEHRDGGENDPGVQSVRQIYAYYKQNGIKTEIMGASFRNTDQIRHLAGCDLLTISPALLEELSQTTSPLAANLSSDWAAEQPKERLPNGEAAFRYALNQNAMATEKLAEGIRVFVKDTKSLEDILTE